LEDGDEMLAEDVDCGLFTEAVVRLTEKGLLRTWTEAGWIDLPERRGFYGNDRRAWRQARDLEVTCGVEPRRPWSLTHALSLERKASRHTSAFDQRTNHLVQDCRRNPKFVGTASQ
jgi:hypothetical protein